MHFPPSRPAPRRPVHALFALLLLAVAGLPLAACSPVGVAVGAGAIAGSAALEERGLDQSLTDKGTEVTILKKLADYRFDTFRRVGVAVHEGRVLLTGIVPAQEDRVEAVRVAWDTDGVVDVVNEILIGEGIGTIDTSYDIRITTELRTDITFDSQVKAVNYDLEAVGGTVYLFGIAQSEAEIDRVKAHARTISNVRRIVSHMLLEDGERRKSLLEALEKERARVEAEAPADAAPADDPEAGQ